MGREPTRTAAAALERAGAVLGAVAARALRLAAVATVAGAVTWWALYLGIEPGDVRASILLVAGVLLAFPPTALVLFAVAARALASVPERIREAPGAVRHRAGEISRRAGDLADARRRGFLPRIRSLARLWWSVASVREVLRVLSPAAVLLRSTTLVAALIALPAAVLEILLGAGALIWLLV